MYALCHPLSREVEGVSAVAPNFRGNNDLLTGKVLQGSSQHLQKISSGGLCILACCVHCKALGLHSRQNMQCTLCVTATYLL